MSGSIVSVVEKLLAFADYHEDMNDFGVVAVQLHRQVRGILPLVESALSRTDDERVRADLEEIYAACKRAIVRTHTLTLTAANVDAA